MWVLLRPHDSEEPNMQTVTTIGLDIAKSVFQIHGIDGNVTWSFAVSSSAATFCYFFRSYHRALLASKPAFHLIIGQKRYRGQPQRGVAVLRSTEHLPSAESARVLAKTSVSAHI